MKQPKKEIYAGRLHGRDEMIVFDDRTFRVHKDISFTPEHGNGSFRSHHVLSRDSVLYRGNEGLIGFVFERHVIDCREQTTVATFTFWAPRLFCSYGISQIPPGAFVSGDLRLWWSIQSAAAWGTARLFQSVWFSSSRHFRYSEALDPQEHRCMEDSNRFMSTPIFKMIRIVVILSQMPGTVMMRSICRL